MNISKLMTFILETWQYFGISQNRIEDKQSGTEGIFIWFLNATRLTC